MSDARIADLKGVEGLPRHIAIIMDGNGRWAEQRGLPRSYGHKKGVETVRDIVRLSGELGVEYLTLFSFSSENWSRPEAEIKELFSLLRNFIRRDLAELHENGVRIRIIGSRDKVPDDVLKLLDEAVGLTQSNKGQTLVIAFNYGARSEIVDAAKMIAMQVASGELDLEAIDENIVSENLYTQGIPDPDLLIRTSGEVRVSNFLLWQCAYTEMVFSDCLWPDFDASEYAKCIDNYCNRTRRYGGLAKGAVS